MTDQEKRLVSLAIVAGATVRVVTKEGNCIAEMRGDERAMLDVVREIVMTVRDETRAELQTLIRELKDARSVAALLAHAYDHDSRPSASALSDARAWLPKEAP